MCLAILDQIDVGLIPTLGVIITINRWFKMNENENNINNNFVVIITDENDFKNKLYDILIRELQPFEHNGKYKGNSHHLTQRLTEQIVNDILKGELEWK